MPVVTFSPSEACFDLFDALQALEGESAQVAERSRSRAVCHFSHVISRISRASVEVLDRSCSLEETGWGRSEGGDESTCCSISATRWWMSRTAA